jgi:serine/threonine-protein kinase ATR
MVIVSMLEKYPFQTFWNSLILYNSKKPEIKQKAGEIIENLTFDKRTIFRKIVEFSEKLTNISKSTLKKLCFSDFPEFKDLLPSKINIPGQMTEINSIKDEIVVFHSLQMPKKIILVGEDGISYEMIVKFKDDLRKDSRFIDLDNLLNKIFDDGYYIRNYNVIPFTHDSGIIQFVPNLINLKEIVYSKYNNINETIYKFTKFKRIGGNNLPGLCSQFKSVYCNYLMNNFNNPYLFYTSRENYIKTYAIMNIVGWFMGLGDRHTENIHFDKINGDTVHVDLNYIFDKAKSLEIPEKVPFRLTQNIIDGFGILGVNGTYKQTMKYTLGILKDNRDVIQANLLSFVFDPLFEWAWKKAEPTKIIEGMNKKLDYEDEDEKVEELIEEATDIDNLGSIYIGWMPFI